MPLVELGGCLKVESLISYVMHAQSINQLWNCFKRVRYSKSQAFQSVLHYTLYTLIALFYMFTISLVFRVKEATLHPCIVTYHYSLCYMYLGSRIRYGMDLGSRSAKILKFCTTQVPSLNHPNHVVSMHVFWQNWRVQVSSLLLVHFLLSYRWKLYFL